MRVAAVLKAIKCRSGFAFTPALGRGEEGFFAVLTPG